MRHNVRDATSVRVPRVTFTGLPAGGVRVLRPARGGQHARRSGRPTRRRSTRPSRRRWSRCARSSPTSGRSTSSGPTTTCASPRTARRTRRTRARYCEGEGGAGYYFHLGADGMLVGVGYYSMAKDQLERFRAAVDDETPGPRSSRHRRRAGEEGLHDRRDGGAEDGTAWLRQGPPAHRAAAAQGPDGVASSSRCRRGCTPSKAVDQGPRDVGRRGSRCAPGSTPTSARAPCRPTRPASESSEVAVSRLGRSGSLTGDCDGGRQNVSVTVTDGRPPTSSSASTGSPTASSTTPRWPTASSASASAASCCRRSPSSPTRRRSTRPASATPTRRAPTPATCGGSTGTTTSRGGRVDGARARRAADAR